ncbi:hypothetical protein Cni_G13114 [Canna indica]|uniref:Uncharacterized protein n=1 Tax=Canna indica TaxID=4628 RepID=A0AAQ3QCT9_9LILI|nr:hypothetical protein Cni_G13114 [Canna indica]
MLSLVLSTLASEGVIGQANREDPPDDKRPKLQHNTPLPVPSQPLRQFPMSSFPHPGLLHQLPPLQSTSPAAQPVLEPPLLAPSSSMPPATTPATTQLMQSAAGPMTGVPYNYGSILPPLPNYPLFGMYPNPSAPNPFYSFQPPEEINLFVQPPLPTGPPPLTRQ